LFDEPYWSEKSWLCAKMIIRESSDMNGKDNKGTVTGFRKDFDNLVSQGVNFDNLATSE
jgi:hypothetical protein